MRVFLSIFLFLFSSVSFAQNDEEANPPSVYVFPFEGEVEIALTHVFERGFREAEEKDVSRILIEVDTPGGRVDAALEIIDMIIDSKTPTTILVTGDATSAGALISIAADEIYMVTGSSIGTAAPVMLGGGESETMQVKINSYLLAKVRGICEKRGYSEEKTNIILAMVDKDMEVKDPNDPDKYISKEGKLLTLTALEAEKIGFIQAVVKNREEALKRMELEDANLIILKEHPFEKVARFLSSTTISSLLIMVGFLGLFLEFRTPGFGLPGIVGIMAITFFFWGHTIASLAGFEGPLLFLLGILLLSVELFIIPGFGLTGILGIICVFASFVVTMLDRPITSPHFFETFEFSDLYSSLFITTISMLVGGSIAMILPFLFPIATKTRMGTWMFLDEQEDREKGYQSAADDVNSFIGKRGISKSVLRPAGIADIEGKRVDVVSVGGYIPSHTPVEVIKVEGRRIVVRQA